MTNKDFKIAIPLGKAKGVRNDENRPRVKLLEQWMDLPNERLPYKLFMNKTTVKFAYARLWAYINAGFYCC